MGTKKDKDLYGMEYSIRDKISNIKNANVNAAKAEIYKDALERADERARTSSRVAKGLGVFTLLSNAVWWFKSNSTAKHYKDEITRLEDAVSECEDALGITEGDDD